MLRKSFIAIAMIAIMIVSPILTSAEREFSDLKKDNDHYDGIQWLVTKGITGYPDGTFGVSTPLSRQHAAIMFSKVLALDLPAKSKVEDYFNDVKRNHEYADYIGAMYESGIFTGSGGKFLPNNQLTREQMATTLVNAFDLKGTDKVKIRLDNVDPSHKDNVQILADLGITTELNDFRPRQAINRGQFASFLYRVAKLDQEPDPEPNKKIVTTKYNYDFSAMVDAQMKVRPQTDSTGSWYHASKSLVEYYTNPNNFAQDSTAFYQFLVLSGSSTISDKELNDKILAGKGVLAGKAADFKEASRTYNVNEIYLIAHALLETGHGTSKLAIGVEVGQKEDKDGKLVAVMATDANRDSLKNIKKTYNFYGIGAVDRDPLKLGSERAYKEGWFTPKDAIIGGAEFINNGYIARGQDTLFKMRWNPENPGQYPQYATDVGWAVKQTSQKVYELYQNLGNVSMTFDVPAFNKQPAAKAKPTGAAVFHVDTTHKDVGEKAIVIKDVNFRTEPTTEKGNDTVIRQLPKGTEITIIGENSGWYKIKAGNDEGWVSASYIQIGELIKASTYLVSMEEEVISEQDNELTTSAQTDRVIGEIIKDNVLVRETPSLSEITSVAELQAGTKVDILEEEANWYKVSFDDKEGWISSETIHFINILQVAASESIIQVKIDPNENSSTIGELFENETVIVVPDENKELTIDGEWYQIYYEGHTGWVHKDLLNID